MPRSPASLIARSRRSSPKALSNLGRTSSRIEELETHVCFSWNGSIGREVDKVVERPNSEHVQTEITRDVEQADLIGFGAEGEAIDVGAHDSKRVVAENEATGLPLDKTAAIWHGPTILASRHAFQWRSYRNSIPLNTPSAFPS